MKRGEVTAFLKTPVSYITGKNEKATVFLILRSAFCLLALLDPFRGFLHLLGKHKLLPPPKKN